MNQPMTLDQLGKPPSPEQMEARRQEVLGVVQDLVDCCELLGLVLTVEQVPLKPLAMGHHKTVVSVRWGKEMQAWANAGPVVGGVQ